MKNILRVLPVLLAIAAIFFIISGIIELDFAMIIMGLAFACFGLWIFKNKNKSK